MRDLRLDSTFDSLATKSTASNWERATDIEWALDGEPVEIQAGVRRIQRFTDD